MRIHSSMEVIFSVSNDDILAENEPHNPLRADFAALREYAARNAKSGQGKSSARGRTAKPIYLPVVPQCSIEWENANICGIINLESIRGKNLLRR